MSLTDIFLFSINAILPLILLILLGYFLKEINLLTKEFLKIGNKMVFRVSLPVLLFCNIVELESISEIPWSVVGYVLCVIIILLVLGFIASFATKEKKQKGVIMQCIYRSNFALIGIPLAEMIGGSDGVTVAAILSAFTIPTYNILAVIVLSAFVTEKNGNKKILMQIKGIAKNPLIIGVVLGIIALIIKQTFATSALVTTIGNLTFIQTTLKYIARTATPLALIVLGGTFEFESVKGYRKQIIIATIGRTIIAPLIGVGGAYVLMRNNIINFEPEAIAALIALYGTPVAVSSAIMAEEMKNDGQLAAQLVVWTSIISIFTLFLLIFITRLIGIL